MPERNILMVLGSWVYKDFHQVYQYYAAINQETGRALGLCVEQNNEEYLLGRVNSFLDSNGEVVAIVNADERFKTHLYTNMAGNQMYGVILPETLVWDFGIRAMDYLDVTFIEVERSVSISGRNTKMSRPIFPKILRYGKWDIQPKSALPQVMRQLPEVLIEKKFKSEFYSALVYELNVAYGYGLIRSTLILYRVLLENLLVDLLRSKFGMQKIDMFFDSSHKRFHDFSVLIDNLKKNLGEFKPYSAALNTAFVDRLSKYKEIANASAHRLESDVSPEFFLTNKGDMNFICTLLVDVIEKITSRSL